MSLQSTTKRATSKRGAATPAATKRATAKQTRAKRATRAAQSHAASNTPRILLLFSVVFLALTVGATLWHMLPLTIALGYLCLSLLTFIAYAIDKSAAKRGKWRTQESTLHILALMGGWPGAVIAQQLLRHKSVKTSFRTVFYFTLIANLLLLAYGLHSGATALLI